MKPSAPPPLPPIVIRPALPGDAIAVADLGEQFHRVSEYGKHYPYSRDKTRRSYLSVLANPNAAIFVADKEGQIVGVQGGLIHDYPYSDTLIGEGMFWFVHPSHRGRVGGLLMKTLLAWFQARGAVTVQFCVTTADTMDAIEPYFNRLGLRRGGVVYQKEF